MRAHGVPHPNPDRNGDFKLTLAQEARMRAVGQGKVRATDKLCFHYLKPVVNTTPLSRQAGKWRIRQSSIRSTPTPGS